MFASRRRLLDTFRPPLLIPLLLLNVLACSDPVGPDDGAGGDIASVIVSANVAGTPIDVLVVTVTAPDIPTNLVFNLPVVEGTAQGTLKVPPGDNRLISVEAFDDEGNVTHDGSTTVAVRAGINPAVNIPLRPRAGQVPVTMSMGSFAVQLMSNPGGAFLGETSQYQAIIISDDGTIVDGSVQWATTNPAIATVNSDGLLTGVREGVAQIVATFDGYAAVAQLVVTDDNLAGFYQGEAVVWASGGLAAQLGESFLTEALLGCPANVPCGVGAELFQSSTGYDFLLYFPLQPFFGAVTAPDRQTLLLESIVYETQITILSPVTVTCTSMPSPLFSWYFAVPGPKLSTAGMPVAFNCTATDPVLGTMTANIFFEISLDRHVEY